MASSVTSSHLSRENFRDRCESGDDKIDSDAGARDFGHRGEGQIGEPGSIGTVMSHARQTPRIIRAYIDDTAATLSEALTKGFAPRAASSWVIQRPRPPPPPGMEIVWPSKSPS